MTQSYYFVFGKKFGVKLGKQNIGFSEEELVLLFPLFSIPSKRSFPAFPGGFSQSSQVTLAQCLLSLALCISISLCITDTISFRNREPYVLSITLNIVLASRDKEVKFK